MKKKPSERLQTVLKLAQLKEQLAAEKLAESMRVSAAQEQQELQLQGYKREYSEQFKGFGTEGVSSSQLVNFQRFYAGLEDAGKAQQERVVLSAQQCDAARAQWQKQYSRQQNMQKLIQQKQQQEQREEDNQEQRLQDDRRVILPPE